MDIPVLFHGTNHEFDRFDDRYYGKSCRNPTTEFGFFFSEDREDALSWALREQGRKPQLKGKEHVLEIRLHLTRLKELSYTKFLFYLQRAKTSTIQKHKRTWQDEGYDGLTVIRDGHRWFAAFDPAAIEII